MIFNSYVKLPEGNAIDSGGHLQVTMVFDWDIDMGFAILDLRGFSPLQGPKKNVTPKS